MSLDKSFTDEDKTKVVDFLNFVAKNATFEVKTPEIIEYFKMLTFMQRDLLPKIDKHVFEVKKIVDAQEDNGEGE